MYSFETLITLPLAYHDAVRILGISPDGTIYVEEYYGDDGWLAQHAITLTGAVIASSDEESGRRVLRPLPLPAGIITGATPRHTLALNFAGPRHRGLREPERIDGLARPLTIATKIDLINRLRLEVPPPALLGVAESYVMAEAALTPHIYLVCRRLRLAYALPQPRLDASQQPYDYDTLELYVAHLYDIRTEEHELPPATVFAGLPGVTLIRPMDCLIGHGYAIVADGGTADQSSRLHVWRLHAG